jgi:site-specific DNA-methyltransferase (adenine-specific)
MPRLNRLVQDDCTQLLSTLPKNSVDFVLTDPPYLVNYRDRSGRTVQGDVDDHWVRPAFEQIHRVMKPNTLCLSFYGWTHAEKFLSAWKSVGLRPVGHIVFVKSYTSGSGFLKRRHEQAMLLAKGWPNLPGDRQLDVMPWGHYTGNQLHATQKPVELLQRLIRGFTKPGELVLDPFCGSGSTLVAASLEGRRAIGIEKDPEVFRIARKRLGC